MNSANQLVLTTLQLENIFCYEQIEVSFEPGVSVFAGDNGSGKSSLMESVFFGLFGSNTKKITGKDLSEVLREGQRSGTLTLKFSFSNSDYVSQFVLKRTGKRVGAEGHKCLLFKDGDQVAEKVTEVTRFIQSMLKMDAQDFANCLYVRQGQVDHLINAKPEERQRMIDRLLRLNKIDDYEGRLKSAETALNSRNTLVQGRIDALLQDIKQLEAQDLAAQILKYQKDLAQLETTQQTLQHHLADEEKRIRHLQETLARYDQTINAMQQLQITYEQTTQRLQTTEAQLQQVQQQHQHTQQALSDLKAQQTALYQEALWQQQGLKPPLSPALVEQLRQDQAEKGKAVQNRKEALVEIRSELKINAQATTEASAQRNALKPELSQHSSTLLQLETQINDTLQTLHPLPQTPLNQLPLSDWAQQNEQELEQQRQVRQRLREKAAALASALNTLEKEQQRIKDLVAQGRCPSCGQTVTLASLDEQSASLERQTATHRQQLAAINKQLEDLDGRMDVLYAKAQSWAKVLDWFKQWNEAHQRRAALWSQHEQLSQKIDRLEAQQRQLRAKEDTLVGQAQRAKQRLDSGEKVLALVERSLRLQENVAQHTKEKESLVQRQNTLTQLRDGQRRELQQLGERFDALKAELEGQSPEGLKDELHQHQQRQQALSQEFKQRQHQRDEILRQLGQLNTQQQHLEQQKRNLALQRERQDTLATIQAEVQRLQNVYHSVRTSQRKKNFDALNTLFDYFFNLMQPGPAYHSVHLDEACNIEVVRTNAQTISPALLSGGERALLNLALRAALHQVICEAGGVLLPLFFDEPTVFLDARHTQQLERLFEELGQRVGQVVVVSHEAALVEGATHEYLVSKDADNLSRVKKVR